MSFLGEKNEGNIGPDAEKDFTSLAQDILGDDVGGSDSEDDYDFDKKGKGRKGKPSQESDAPTAYMLFDFRKGSHRFPAFCELIDPKRAESIAEKASKKLEEAAKLKKKDDANDDDADKKDSRSVSVSIGPSLPSLSTAVDDEDDEDEKQMDASELHPDATFDILKDGSTAFVLKPGYRLKLKLNDLLDGGDANREERQKKEAAKLKKKTVKGKGSVMMEGFGNDPWDIKSSKWFKSYINEYTITMDIKLIEDPPRDGMALFQTALVHGKENKRTGKFTLTKSDGECIINQAGGVGMFGTYGDISKSKVETGHWKRVVVSVKCGNGEKGSKGEMRTWVGTETGAVLKEDTIVADERFAIDPDGLYLFSSAQVYNISPFAFCQLSLNYFSCQA
jgi:hypothetical protein